MDAGDAAALTCQWDQFNIPDGLHYLNCAYMGPLPRVAEEAGILGLRMKRDPSSILPHHFFETSLELRELFSGLIGEVDPARISIGPGVSYSVAIAVKNLPLSSDQNVVLTYEQFPSNMHAWAKKAQDANADLRVIGPPDTIHRGASWNEEILTAIDSATAVVSLPTVHWTDGTIFDLVEIGRRCREVGAALVVDGTQSVGALPFDVNVVRPDVLMCSGYKWLLGPYSVGLTYFGPSFDDGEPLEETWIGREGSEDFEHLVDYKAGYQPGAIRYDVAQRSNFALLPVAVASLRLITKWSPGRIQAYCMGLTGNLFEEVEELGFRVEDARWRSAHLFGLRMPKGLELVELQQALKARGVSASLRGSALRVSPNVYNDAADVSALLEGLRQAVAV
jgi:selenocysteine lyase/cysteine desulfurase